MKPEKSPNRKLIRSKQVGGKSCEIEKIPQPEAIKKQVNWGENVKPATKPQLASGVARIEGLFAHHVQLSVGG